MYYVAMRHLLRATTAAALLALCACTSKPVALEATAVQPSRPEPDELVVVATTDFHAALGRAEGLAKVIRGLRARYGDQMIYLDGGDLFQGSLEGNLSKGRSIVDFYNKLGIDAAAIGNHELDFGPDVIGRVTPKGHEDGMGNLKARARQAKFAWLSANIVRSVGSGKITCHPHLGATIEHCNALGNARSSRRTRSSTVRAGRSA